MDRKLNVLPIRLNPCIKESNKSLRDSSVTVVCWHIDVTNLQLTILNHGPARPGPPRVSAFHPVQPRPCRCPSPSAIQSSRVTWPGTLSQSCNVQTPAIRVRASSAPPSTRVHCMCIWMSPIPEPDAPAASRSRGGHTSPVNQPDPRPGKLDHSVVGASAAGLAR